MFLVEYFLEDDDTVDTYYMLAEDVHALNKAVGYAMLEDIQYRISRGINQEDVLFDTMLEQEDFNRFRDYV